MMVEDPMIRGGGACNSGIGRDLAARSVPRVASVRARAPAIPTATSDRSPSGRSPGASWPKWVVTLGELVEAIASVTADVREQAAVVNFMLPAKTVKRVGLVE